MSITDDFKAFWECFPRKIGKLAALKAYQKARTQASADEILAGVDMYLAHLPDDPQFICHAATFLNQGRWMDCYDVPQPKQKPRPTTGIHALWVPYDKRKEG